MDKTERDILVLGFSEDTRALVEHLRAEAPALVERVAIIDDTWETVERLSRGGIAAIHGDPLSAPGCLRWMARLLDALAERR